VSEVLRDEHTVGKVVAVHPETVHVLSEAGVDFELLVPPGATFDLDELRRFVDTDQPVRVRFKGSPGGHSGTLLGFEPA